ncbi:MAG: hypothetical protein M3365_02830 [Gemmatimonadota bacterium]|nr:hypothetical protein [Gemmatimonadota bacterium]
MRGFKFFEEYEEYERGSAGNVIALKLSERSFIQPGAICFEAVCADEHARIPNSPVRPSYVNVEYLGKRCRRISEARARDIHPRLFEFLDALA